MYSLLFSFFSLPIIVFHVPKYSLKTTTLIYMSFTFPIFYLGMFRLCQMVLCIATNEVTINIFIHISDHFFAKFLDRKHKLKNMNMFLIYATSCQSTFQITLATNGVGNCVIALLLVIIFLKISANLISKN